MVYNESTSNMTDLTSENNTEEQSNEMQAVYEFWCVCLRLIMSDTITITEELQVCCCEFSWQRLPLPYIFSELLSRCAKKRL